MSLFDPIESGINSILEPLTSVFALPSSTADGSDSGDSPSTSAVANNPTSAVISVITPTSVIAATSRESSSSPSSASSRTSAAATTASSSTSSRTTLSTSTRSSSTSSDVTSTSSSTSTSTSTPAAPSASSTKSATPTPQPAADSTSSSGGSKISTAGIAVAIVFAIILLITIIWLLMKFCPPIRRRLDAWYERRRMERSYREAIDGPTLPEKDVSPTSTGSSFDGGRGLALGFAPSHNREKSLEAAEKVGIPVDRRPPSKLFGMGANPNIHDRPAMEQNQGSSYSWRAEGPASQNSAYTAAPVHQQYISPSSASPEQRGPGLGLGHVSLLRNQSLLRKAGYDVPPMPGPSMTSDQAAIINSGSPQTRSRASSNASSLQEFRRKPVPPQMPLPVQRPSPTATTPTNRSRPRFSYEPESAPLPPVHTRRSPPTQAPSPHHLHPTNTLTGPEPRDRFSYELETPPIMVRGTVPQQQAAAHAAQQHPSAATEPSNHSSESLSSARSRGRDSPLPRLNVDTEVAIQGTARAIRIERSSQIGLALSSASGSPRSGGGVGVAR